MPDTRSLIPWTLKGSDNESLLGNTHLPKSTPRGCLILIHGFKGYKDYGFFPPLADAAAAAGLVTHRFNLSHSGMTNQFNTFARPDLFEHDTWGKQVHDVKTVVRAVGGALESGGLPITLFGHSRGGLTVVVAAAELGDSVAGLITAASVDHPVRLSDEDRRTLRTQGRLASPSSRTGQTLYVGRDMLDEVEAEPDRFDPLKRIREVRCPIHLIHGGGDTTVEPACSTRLREAAGSARLTILPSASHTFDCPNPAPSPLPPATQRLIELVTASAARHHDT